MKFEYLLLKNGCENNFIYDKMVFLNSKDARKKFGKNDILLKCKKDSIYFADNFRGWSVDEKNIIKKYIK